MTRATISSFVFLAGLALAVQAVGQQVELGSGSVVATVIRLKAGQYVWAPQAAPKGPMLLIVNLSTQRALLFRNGVPIGESTVSSGKPGHQTPTGVFTVLQKQVEHYSSKYDSAPMPYMQRLTWYGVALHAGNLPGYPASHGCIRLPKGFAKLLYGATAAPNVSLRNTVVISEGKASPRIAAGPQVLRAELQNQIERPGAYEWNPEKSPDGPVSVVVSAADRKAIVLRNGIEIGWAAVTVDGPVSGTWAYSLRNADASGQHWIQVSLSTKAAAGGVVPHEEWQRFHAPEAFKRAIGQIVQPGTTVVITTDSLVSGAVAAPVTVIDAGAGPRN